MELTDSGDQVGRDRDTNHHQNSRSGLGIDLNEIPSPSFAETLHDSINIVRTYHENRRPPPGGLAGISGDVWVSTCGACGMPEVRGHVVVCDGCDRGFHVGCAGMPGRQSVNLDEWVCAECVSNGLKSKRWPLGIKSKQLLDINASPPGDIDGEGTEELQDVRKCALGDNSFGAPITHSNFYNGNAYGMLKTSGVVTHAVRVGIDNIFSHTQSTARSLEEADSDFPLGRHRSSNNTAIRLPSQNPHELFLQALRDFISERHGVLEEGWRVEFRQSMSSSELYVIYCAPDGKIFDSVYEVACYLGLMSSYNSMESERRKERSSSKSDVPHLPRKRKPRRSTIANGLAENKGTFVSCSPKDLSSDDVHVKYLNASVNILEGTEIARKEADYSYPQQCAAGLPLQFEDFFVLSLGKVDNRPSYCDINLIWPIGYKSCWHDRITGSLFTCEVLEGGIPGPVFRVRRRSCSKIPVPVGSTTLSVLNHGQFMNPTVKEGERKAYDSMDWEDDGSIQMILSDLYVPTEDDVLSCLASCSNEACNGYTSDILQSLASSVQDKTRNLSSDDFGLFDEIGEILVEERSLSLAWKMVSQKLIDVCTEIFKQKRTLKLYCKHTENEINLHKWHMKDGKHEVHSALVAKYCGSPSFVSIPATIHAGNDVSILYEILGKWLEQDRFGLDVEFVQEILEQLPGVQDCLQYQFLNCRSDCSSLRTVGNGFLVAEWAVGSQYKDEGTVQSLYRRLKKPKLSEEYVKDDHGSPPGKILCSAVPSELVGDVFQAWELLGRFHETLGLKDPLSLDELEKELINPWLDGSYIPEKFEKVTENGQGLSSQRVDGGDGCIFTLSCDGGLSDSSESSHAFIQVETEAAKEAAQVKLASSTYSRCCGVALTKAHDLLLGVLIGELQSKVAALVDPNFDPGETKTRRGRRKDAESAISSKRTKLNMLPINELTWPELARRYVLAVLSMDGNLDSTEITSRESGKVFRCLQGDGGLLCGSLTGVGGMEADALLLAEAKKKIFGSLSRDNDALIIEDEVSDQKGACENIALDGRSIPEWAKMLEPARKLPTNVGTRIRKCVYDALEKDPPEWARKILEHSISKEVYKGNASGPTKKAIISVLADVCGEGMQQKPDKGRKKKTVISISDIIMKQCRFALRHAAAADDAKVFCNLLGRKLINSSDNDDEGLLGSPAMVSRPLDFRTIDLRLAAGAYDGSHEAFLEDVRELWNNVRIAFGDQPDFNELAEKLSQNFESLYNTEVVTYVRKLVEYAKLECLSADARKEINDLLASTSEIPKAPWDEGVCKVCGIDRDDDSVLLCDTCDAEYHTYCLNPPLARIPKGNWYCPSCIDGRHTVQNVVEHAQLIGQCQSKKFRGEATSFLLEALTHLSAIMEEKEYWEYSVSQRTFLLKFLCDELLNSSLIRQYLEQCAELSAELHQKLRALSVEWKNLKIKEDILSTKAAKNDSCSLISAGEIGLKDGLMASFSNPVKSLVQPHTANEGPKMFGLLADSQPSQENSEEKTMINSVDKSISVTNLENDSHNVKSKGLNGKPNNACVSDFSCMDSDSKSCPLSNHIPHEISITDSKYQQGHCLSPYKAVNESEPLHLELNAIKQDISILQDSIVSVESQLLKLSVRQDFLGIDSIGRLYWASSMPGGYPWIVVDASAAVLRGRRMAVNEDPVKQSAVMQNCALYGKDIYQTSGVKAFSPFTSSSDGLGLSSWVAYQSDEEIEKLICWLKDSDPKERELKNSILQWQKLRFQEFAQIMVEGHNEQQGSFSIPRNIDNTSSCSLVTKATSLLEKKYGPFFESDASEVFKKRGKKTKVSNDEKMYRCECLEPIWPSRQHCKSCHKTLLSDIELEEHKNGKCNAAKQNFEKNKDNNGSSKGRGKVKCGSTREKSRGDADMVVTTANGSSELSPRLIKFSNEESKCPYKFEDICSKFVTNNSNKEIVREIGLIGLDGIPSFVLSISPCVSDSTFKLISTHAEGGGSYSFEKPVVQGNANATIACHDHISDASHGKSVGKEHRKAGKSNRPSLGNSGQRDRMSSSCSAALELGIDHCCVVPISSLRPIVGKVSPILRQLKISLLDMDAALPEVSLRPSRAQLERRSAWRAFVKSAGTIYEMVQATITFEDMIKTEYLRNDWWYWSSLSAAAKTSNMSSLALRVYSLDSAIMYEKIFSHSNLADNSEPAAIAEAEPKLVDSEKPKASRRSNRKRKEPDG